MVTEMNTTDDLKQRAEEVLETYDLEVKQGFRYTVFTKDELADCLRAYMQRCEQLEADLKRCQEMYTRDAE